MTAIQLRMDHGAVVVLLILVLAGVKKLRPLRRPL
nr:MAG TPA: hypothetical protein [Bacteriophage sp.]